MKFGILLGITFLIIGGFMSTLGYTMYADAGFAPKVLLFGPCIFFMAIGLLIVPGPNVTVKDIQEKKSDFKDFLSESSITHCNSAKNASNTY